MDTDIFTPSPTPPVSGHGIPFLFPFPLFICLEVDYYYSSWKCKIYLFFLLSLPETSSHLYFAQDDSFLEHIPIHFSSSLEPLAFQEAKFLSNIENRLKKRDLASLSNIWEARIFLTGNIRGTSRI